MLARPQIPDLDHLMESWTLQEIQAFFCCVRERQDEEPPSSREEAKERCIEEIFWAYNSKTRAGIKRTSRRATEAGYKLFGRKLKDRTDDSEPLALHDFAADLSYEYLLRECCKELKIEKSRSEGIDLLETYLHETIIIRAVAAMTAAQRHQFFTQAVSIKEVSLGVKGATIAGPATTLAALTAAQASGFGIYLGATTALGLLSNAIGVTIPFAVYTGMTSTIGFLIGPPGFLAAGLWWGWRATGPDWTRITRALLHIISTREKRRLSPFNPLG